MQHSIDLSHLISLSAFKETYDTLPATMRAQVETILGPIQRGRRPLVLLLLFGLGDGPEMRCIYQQAIARILSEHASDLKGCSLVVKVHPASRGAQEDHLVEWLRSTFPAEIHRIDHALNLEFMLPQLRPDFVVAGLCGSLPIIRRLGIARAVVLSEFLELYFRVHPDEKAAALQMLPGFEVW